ncbi:MAG: dehydrogenase/reductase [Deltaproteobacteria bacterium]|nr:dehydrogenase/reductase [Deltaproteobacteria bacterium]
MIGSFDRTGFARHQRAFRATDLEVDLRGRVCLVTGANAGLGRATAAALAERGATVRLLCRDAGRGEAARDELRRATGSSQIELDLVDVSELASVRRFVERARLPAVHVVVHNAGVLPHERVLTSDQLELCFATHVVGPHLLTRLLERPLRAGGDARVIWVSSGGMYTQRLELDDLDWTRRPYNGVTAYAQTKRMQVVLARRWARELEGEVAVYSMHPGWAETRSVKTQLPRFHRVMHRLLRTPAQGADTIVWLAARRPAPAPSGGLWFDRAARSAHYLPWTREDEARRDALWTMVERLTSAGLTAR